MFNIWVLIENLSSIRKSCNSLKNAHTTFKGILSSKKNHFDAYFQHLDSLVQNILRILTDGQLHLLSSISSYFRIV